MLTLACSSTAMSAPMVGRYIDEPDFEIGDIVVGNCLADCYTITDEGYVGVVTGVDGGSIELDNLYWVCEDCFDLISRCVKEPVTLDEDIPFGMRPRAERGELMAASMDGEAIQFRWTTEENWRDCADPSWNGDVFYRLKPAPTKEMVELEAVRTDIDKIRSELAEMLKERDELSMSIAMAKQAVTVH